MKTIALFTIFVLISGVAFTSLVNDAYAQNDSNILLRIATQADKQILNQLDRSYGDSIPSKIQILYGKGHASVQSLKNSSPDNIEQAREDFLLAMKSFKQITRMISEPVAESKISAYTSESHRDFSSELDRLEKHVQNLKKISEKHNSEINFDEIDNLINEAHIQIDNGTDNASGIIDKLKDLIDSIKKEIRESASHGASDRIKQFVDRQLGNIEKKLTRALDAGADETQIDKAHELIAEIKVLISENDINNAKMVFHDLNKLMKNIVHSVR
jgi:F0F1-type ATP synthase membrane subunit b/b'